MPGMGTKRRGPITLFCESRRFRWSVVALNVLLPVLYIASFGPACWINLRTGRGGRDIGAFYRPIGWLYAYGGDAIGEVIGTWANLGTGDDYQLFYGLADDGPFWLPDLVGGFAPEPRGLF
jgi:hypothetical protein